jgi:hypothetical protein
MPPKTCQASCAKILKKVIEDLKKCFAMLYLVREEEFHEKTK